MEFIKDWAIKITLAGFFLIMLVVYGVAKAPVSSVEKANGGPITWTLVDDKKINIDLAIKPEELTKGLAGLTRIPDDYGKLFVFNDNSYPTIWMKGMNFPLDIAWIDQVGKVVYVQENVPVDDSANPKTYRSSQLANYVLEMKAGSFAEMGIKSDTMLNIKQLIDEQRGI
jgi:hypothetical protein